MTQAEQIQVVEALTVLAEAFRHQVSRMLLLAFVEELDAVPLAAALAAIRAARRGEYFPTIRELLDLAGADLGGDPDYQQIEQMIVWKLRGKSPSTPEFLALVVERMGGWNRVEEMPYLAREKRIREMLPAVLAAAKARGIAWPRATTPIAAEPAVTVETVADQRNGQRRLT